MKCECYSIEIPYIIIIVSRSELAIGASVMILAVSATQPHRAAHLSIEPLHLHRQVLLSFAHPGLMSALTGILGHFHTTCHRPRFSRLRGCWRRCGCAPRVRMEGGGLSTSDLREAHGGACRSVRRGAGHAALAGTRRTVSLDTSSSSFLSHASPLASPRSLRPSPCTRPLAGRKGLH